jgi:hypothetical protein
VTVELGDTQLTVYAGLLGLTANLVVVGVVQVASRLIVVPARRREIT